MTSALDQFEVCIIGAGVIGLATAYELTLQQDIDPTSIILLDKLPQFGQSTSSRNSEVIHAGIYYPPGSLKSRLCLEGKLALYRYLETHDLPFKRIGKLIVAQSHQQDQLDHIAANARACGIDDLERLTKSQVTSLEPSVSACSGLYSPSTGILDSHAYMHNLLNQAERAGVLFSPNTEAVGIEANGGGFTITTQSCADQKNRDEPYRFHADKLVNAAGLEATAVAQSITGLTATNIPKVHFAKGDYFTYTGKSPFTHLVYPIPEANTAGLGVHSTLDMGGQLKFGPDVEYVEQASYDIDSSKKEQFAALIQTYFPDLNPELLQPAYSGIRPKLSGPGEASSDFCIQTQADHGLTGLVQLFGIESPGLTASLAIAKYVAVSLGYGQIDA